MEIFEIGVAVGNSGNFFVLVLFREDGGLKRLDVATESMPDYDAYLKSLSALLVSLNVVSIKELSFIRQTTTTAFVLGVKGKGCNIPAESIQRTKPLGNIPLFLGILFPRVFGGISQSRVINGCMS